MQDDLDDGLEPCLGLSSYQIKFQRMLYFENVYLTGGYDWRKWGLGISVQVVPGEFEIRLHLLCFWLDLTIFGEVK